MNHLKIIILCLSIGSTVGAQGFRVAGPFATSDQAILNQATLQSGASFYVHHGSATTMEALSFVGSLTGASSLNVLKAGDVMTGQLTNESTITVQGAGFSVGGNTFTVVNGNVGIGLSVPLSDLHVNQNGHTGGIWSSTSAVGDNYIQMYYNALGGGIDTGAGNLWINPDGGVVSLYNGTDDFIFRIYSGAAIKHQLNSAGDSYMMGGDIGIGTTNPNSKFEVRNGTVTISTTTGDFGIRFQDETFQNTAYSPVFVSSEPGHTPDIASTAYVGISTVSFTLAYARPVKYDACLTLDNGAGSSKDYTLSLAIDGAIIHTHTLTNEGNTDSPYSDFESDISLASGSHTFSIWIKSSSAVGTQVAKDVHLLVEKK